MKRSESTSEPPKVVRTPGVFNILTSKRASRHNCVHFFDISTAKSGPDLVCFVHFDFEMCFAPRHNGVHFFDIATSKSGPRMVCFVEGSLEVKLPTVWTDEKQSRAEAERRERLEERRVEEKE